ncbi:MAG: bifunctional salicylyl-CoA 5-hydroxylase/oxidoreductase [Gemmatimonadetes bacterium]|nr:bifunctional salicylyl-CoA 5-hydroxylase/oxidoreductase [Gemmatimonadota bacterium]
MKIACVGGGPAGLFFALLMKKRHPDHEVVVYERNRVDDTFGFGVVFSDATAENLALADPLAWERVSESFHHWDDIDIFYRGERLRSTGHGFAGVSRVRLLEILAERCREVGVTLRFEHEVDDVAALAREVDLVVAADGVNSAIRQQFEDDYEPSIDWRPNRFVWLGTTKPLDAFTFWFKESEHGLWRVHAYQYEPGSSTFIVECTGETFERTGLSEHDEDATLAFCEKLFAEELGGHRLQKNRSLWRRFPTIRNGSWRHGNVVLMGDAVHTAHFSIGSGTKLAMEDAIALADALDHGGDLAAAVEEYENDRRPAVESLQRAAQASLQWFEETERYWRLAPIQFGFSLLTRSLRITHEDLRVRDPDYVRSVDEWYAEEAHRLSGAPIRRAPDGRVSPPMFTPFRLRELLLPNRVVVSAMCQYKAEDGLPNDWHLVHLGSRAVGGAGLVMTEMTDVAPEARITPGCAGLWNGQHVDAWRRVVRFVHAETEARIGLQLAHAGRKGATKVAWEGIDEPLNAGGWPLVAPSPMAWADGSVVPREMTREDLARVREDFVRSAELEVEAGFDLIELHFAHGYLLGSFISPLTNLREDEYGGSLENRLRFPLEVFDGVRAAWPPERPISIRISATDWAPGGIDAADSVEVARLLRERGVDLVDVSAGQTVPYARPIYGRQFQTPFSDRIRHEVGIATMAVGNISSYMDVNTILAAGRADLCALARAHLWDPYWTRNAAQKQGWPLPWPAPYSSLDRYTPRFD